MECRRGKNPNPAARSRQAPVGPLGTRRYLPAGSLGSSSMGETIGFALAGELAERQRELHQAGLHATDLAGGLTAAGFNWRPGPDRWSIGQCLDHLNRTGYQYRDTLTGIIEDARARRRLGNPPYRHGWMGRLFIWYLEPPPRLRVTAPRSLRPAPELDPGRTLAEFQQLQEELIQLVRRANGLDLGAVRFPSPFFRLLRLSLGQGFASITAHERRHLQQADRVRTHPGFPA